MFKTKKLIIAGITCVTIAIAAIVTLSIIDEKTPAPSDVVPATPPAQEQALDIESLQNTDQYKSIALADNQYSGYFSNGTMDGATPTELVLATWTVDQYIQNAITNPYFISGYWEKDNYSEESINKYISPYVSKDLTDVFISDSQSITNESIPEAISDKIFVPDASYAVPSKCYETWKQEYCTAETYKINNFNFAGQQDGSIKISVEVNITPLYQKPNSPEGNLSSQNRTYFLDFTLALKNQPESNTTKIPIMIIDNLSSSLGTDELNDFIVNEG